MYKTLFGFLLVVWSLTAFGQDAPAAQNTSLSQPSAVAVQIGEPAFTVAAGTFKDYKFSVPQGLKKVGVFGHFKATGGAHNDIVVLVMSDDQYVNWRNGRETIKNNPVKDSFTGALYTSHLVTQGTIKRILSTDAATYHLVFYNRFSLLTPKAVEAKIEFRYIK
jgi:hypothetical protein